MADSDHKETGGSTGGDGSGETPPPEKKQETVSDIREEVNQAIENVFGNLDNDDDGDGSGETPPLEKEQETVSDIREEVNQAIENVFGNLDDDDDGDDVDVAADAPAPARATTEIALDTPSPVADTTDPPTPPTESVIPARPPATKGKTNKDVVVPPPPEKKEPQTTHTASGPVDQTGEKAMTDSDLEVTTGSAGGDGGGETPPPGKGQETVSDLPEEVNQALDDVSGNLGDDDAGAGIVVVDDAPAPARTTTEIALDTPFPVADAMDPSIKSSPASEVSSKPILKASPPLTDPAEPVKIEPNEQPPEVKTTAQTLRPATGGRERTQPAPPPAEQKPRQPLTTRIFVWGAVLIIITVTVRYFVTYDAEELAPAPTETGQLFHKITPLPLPTASSPPAVGTPQAAPSPEVSAPKTKSTDTVNAYIPQAYPYAIHMASFQSLAVAKESVAQYYRGFQAFLVRVDLGKKGLWYRLYFGHFPSATTAVDAIKKYHLTDALISRTRYACLLGSYASAAQAAAATRLLAGKGFFPYTITIGETYHVFVGAHPTMAAAGAVLKELSANGFTGDLIER